MIKRLRRELDWYAKERDRLLYSEAEIERLRKVRENEGCEIERLRAALQEIASDICSRSGAVDIARRALERKP